MLQKVSAFGDAVDCKVNRISITRKERNNVEKNLYGIINIVVVQ